MADAMQFAVGDLYKGQFASVTKIPRQSHANLNRRGWLNLAAAECLSISAAARLAAWQCSLRLGMPRRA